MELQGKVVAIMPRKKGTSARGEWEAQDFVIETHDAYPRHMVFSVFGAERLQRFDIRMDQEIVVSFDIDAREWNGRWFNSIRAFNVRPADAAGVGNPQTQIDSVLSSAGMTPLDDDPFGTPAR